MADLSITVANVVPVAGFTSETGYLAGATITRGQSVYLDTNASPPSWKLADVDASALAAGSGGVGISLSDVASGQPMIVMTGGDLGLGAILTQGVIYCVGDDPGTICPYGDLASGDRVTILGKWFLCVS